MIGRDISHYRVLEKLGGGGMGVVYKAEDTQLGRAVALKLISPELLANEGARKRFIHEARAASLIDHPNVCHVYEVGEAPDGRLFMAMSFCEGHSLREVIDQGPIAPREAFGIAFGIAQGLWAAHRRGIVHRDVKPGNAILTEDGLVRIFDFGLALLVGHSRVTTSGIAVGTAAYMSPEQASGGEVDERTDIWSLGVTLYEMMTGRLPFRGEINPAIVYSIVHEPHKPLAEVNPSIPAECIRVVDRCLEKDPEKRYRSVTDLLEDMVGVARRLGWDASAASASIAPILHDRRWRIWKRRLLVGGAAAVVVAGGWFAYHKLRPAQSPYSTEIRLAVLPLDNLIGAENEAFVDGLSDHVTRVARWVGRTHPSMWTLVYSAVAQAKLPGPGAAAAAFGVNRLITGDVQRLGSGHQLRLALRDATAPGDAIAEVSIPFDLDAPAALADSILPVIDRWCGAPRAGAQERTPWRVREPAAIRPYLEGLSGMRRGGRDAGLADLALAGLEAGAARDTSFAWAACAAGFAELQRFQRGKDDRAWLDRARSSGLRALRHAPGLTDAYILLGEVCRATGSPDSAEAWYRRAAAVEPASVTAYERLGNLFVGQDRLQEAEAAYRRAVEENPDYAVAHRILGVFYYGRDRLDEADAAWSTAANLAPGDVQTLSNLGAVRYYRGDWAGAHEVFMRSFQALPNCENVTNVATTLFLDGRYADAAEYFKLALSPGYCDSTDYEAWGNLGNALYWAEGEREHSFDAFRRAIARAEAVLESGGEEPRLLGLLIEYRAMSGDTARAKEMMARAAPYLEKNEYVMYRVGSAYERLGERELALQHLGNAVRHGYAVPLILADPVLRDLKNDQIFLDMIQTEQAAEGAEAAGSNR